MEKDHACPNCDGRKTVCGFVIDPGSSRIRISSEAPCPQCRGEGMVTQAQQEWIRVGKQCRQERLSRLEFASEAARRLDISIEQLMAAEMGEYLRTSCSSNLWRKPNLPPEQVATKPRITPLQSPQAKV